MQDAISNFAALYDKKDLWADKRPEKLYSDLFTPEQAKNLGKSAKIKRILDNFRDNPRQLREAVQNIIEHHPKDYAVKNLKRLRNILHDMGIAIQLDKSGDLIIEEKTETDEAAIKEPEKIAVEASNLMSRLQSFIDEPPVLRILGGTFIDPQWLRQKALQLNELTFSAKCLIGLEFNMDDFRVNPDLVLSMCENAWGHLQSLALKLKGEVAVFKKNTDRA